MMYFCISTAGGENFVKLNLNAIYKGKSLTEDEWVEAFVKEPKLLERPIVIKGNKGVLGRPPENVLSLF